MCGRAARRKQVLRPTSCRGESATGPVHDHGYAWRLCVSWNAPIASEGSLPVRQSCSFLLIGLVKDAFIQLMPMLVCYGFQL